MDSFPVEVAPGLLRAVHYAYPHCYGDAKGLNVYPGIRKNAEGGWQPVYIYIDGDGACVHIVGREEQESRQLMLL